MEIIDERIDGGKAFGWGKTSREYVKYRDIYPEVFYQKIEDRGLCISVQNVLDLGTGTGAGETRHPIWIPDIAFDYFELRRSRRIRRRGSLYKRKLEWMNESL